MKNRQVTHEGRRLIVPDSGTPFAATVYREKDGIDYEGIIEEGTPYNVESILPDTTAESLGLDPEADPTPADALQAIAQAFIVPLDIQELYKPLVAPLSVSLTGFVEGSYLLYGKFYDDVRVFVKVSKSTAMSGSVLVGDLPVGYRPAEYQELTAYDEDGNIIADARVYITSISGGVYVAGYVDANVIVMAAYKSS